MCSKAAVQDAWSRVYNDAVRKSLIPVIQMMVPGGFCLVSVGKQQLTCQPRARWAWTRTLPPKSAEWTGSVCSRRGQKATHPPGNGWRLLGRKWPGATGHPEPDWRGRGWAPPAGTSPTDISSLESHFPPDPPRWWLRRRQRFRSQGARCTVAAPPQSPESLWSHSESSCSLDVKRLSLPATSQDAGGRMFPDGEPDGARF